MKHSFDDLDVAFSPQIDTLGTIPIGLRNTKADLDITLPQFVSFGIAWSRGPLTLTLDGFWVDWSELDALNFELDNPVAGKTSLRTPVNWNDAWSWAVGMEYIVNVWDRDISLRTGFMYEECPTPNETVMPIGYNGDNFLYNIGFGSKFGSFIFDFYVTYNYTEDRNWNNQNGYAPNPGGGQVTGEFTDYESSIIGANLTYKF